MFNIIETPQNYFTRELLHDNLSSNVALHFNISHWQPYLVVSCSEKVFCRPSTACVGDTDTSNEKKYTLQDPAFVMLHLVSSFLDPR